VPKQTFLNLPDAKRNAILEVAIAEFSEHDYQNASISRIVAQLGIAKGSFYQYFEDKRDLYLYLISLAVQEEIRFTQSSQPFDPSLGFFEYLQSVLEAGVRFSLSYPQHTQIIYRAMYGATPFSDQAVQRMRDASMDYIRQILSQGISAGEIKPNIDLDLIAGILNVILHDFGKLLIAKPEHVPQELMMGNHSQLDMSVLRDKFIKLIEFLRFGLSSRS
jgi:AcrR family transcriptional regulator